jgi:hypothetical protein
MQMAVEQLEPPAPAPQGEPAHRRPAGLDFLAAFLLLSTVVLHVVAMFPSYVSYGGALSLASQTDQATQYAVLAAAWALCLAVGFAGPHRTPVAAALSVGVAVTELGFRVADLGPVFRYGTGVADTGLWLMVAAWGVGAVGSVVAVLAARARHATPKAAATAPVDNPPVTFADPAPDLAGAPPPQWIQPVGPADSTSALPRPDATSAFASLPGPGGRAASEDGYERNAWTALVVVLAGLAAGAFIPAWDDYTAVSSVSRQTVHTTNGSAFTHVPWQQATGYALVTAALALVPVVAIRLRHKPVGAAAVIGSLLVLTAQLVSAVVQIDLPVSPAVFNLTQSQASQLGLQLSVKLSGWFTVDALASYALFAAVLVWATLRAAQENSAGTAPSAPDWRNPAIPSAS